MFLKHTLKNLMYLGWIHKDVGSCKNISFFDISYANHYCRDNLHIFRSSDSLVSRIESLKLFIFALTCAALFVKQKISTCFYALNSYYDTIY